MLSCAAVSLLRRGRCIKNIYALSQCNLAVDSRNRTNEYTKSREFVETKRSSRKTLEDHRSTITSSEDISPEQLLEKSSNPEWADTFGSLSENSHKTSSLDDEADEDEEPHLRLSKKFRKHDPDWYGRKIEKLGKVGKVHEAVQVLEKEMLVDDRVMPNEYVFSTLIGILGRVGYTKKAFKVFNQMKKFGIKPIPHTYTALFNSCSNSPSQEDGLERATKLRELMKAKDVETNMITYQSMIKAFAHLGEVQTAFSIADEAVSNNRQWSKDTFAFLMMACIADKEAGFSLLIKTWREMRKKKLEFKEYHYDLLLECSRDCGIGNEVAFEDLLNRDEDEANRRLNEGPQVKRTVQQSKTITDGGGSQLIRKIDSKEKYFQTHESSVDRLDVSTVTNVPIPDDLCMGSYSKLPNVLSPTFTIDIHPDWAVTIPQTSTDRLLFLGGVVGILKHLERDRLQPTLKTFALLMDMLPSSLEYEEKLLSLMDKAGIKPDVTLFNAVIKRRCQRWDYEGAKEAFDLILEHDLKPNEKTFGCLATGCATEIKGMGLLHDMMKLNIYPNAEICDTLVTRSRMNFRYKFNILRFMTENRIRPNKNLLQKLETQIQSAKTMILKRERGEDVPDHFRSEPFQKSFDFFIVRYKSLLSSMEVEPEIHPWVQYDQPVPQDPE